MASPNHNTRPGIHKCAWKMRKRPTKSERLLYELLTAAAIIFKPQFVIGRYIPDCVIPSRMLVIEVDGSYHLDPGTQQKDQERTRYLESLGFQVIRIPNRDVVTWQSSNLDPYPVVAGKVFRRAMEQSKAAWSLAKCSVCGRTIQTINGKLARHGPRRSCNGHAL